MSSNSNYFDFIDSKTEVEAVGVVYLNDLGMRSNFVFAQWGVPVVRPASLECAEKIANIFMDKSLPSSSKNPYLDALSESLLKGLRSLNSINQESFCLMVSFDQKQKNNFDLNFSKKANPKIMEPIEKNFTASKQKFNTSYSCTSILFQRIEESFPSVSCLELSFGPSIENNLGEAYSKERVFEETLIFANLAITKRL